MLLASVVGVGVLCGMEKSIKGDTAWEGFRDTKSFAEQVTKVPKSYKDAISFIKILFEQAKKESQLLSEYRPAVCTANTTIRWNSMQESQNVISLSKNRQEWFVKINEWLNKKGIIDLAYKNGNSFVLWTAKFPEIVIRLSKLNWYTCEFDKDWPAKIGERNKYQMVSRLAYHVQIKKIVKERKLKKIFTGNMILLFHNESEEEPNDDNCAIVCDLVENFSPVQLKVLFAKARKGDKDALQVVAEAVQVIRWAGLWDISESNVSLCDDKGERKIAFVDAEQPGIGGNPWLLKTENHMQEPTIKPWLKPNPEQIRNGSGLGMKKFMHLLFGIKVEEKLENEICNCFMNFAQTGGSTDDFYKNLTSLGLTADNT